MTALALVNVWDNPFWISKLIKVLGFLRLESQMRNSTFLTEFSERMDVIKLPISNFVHTLLAISHSCPEFPRRALKLSVA